MTDWRPIGAETWAKCERIAAGKTILARETKYANGRIWSADESLYRQHLHGQVGEALFSEISRWPMKEEISINDGGSDFPGIDVKATRYWERPLLLRMATDSLKAPVFALVAVHEEQRRARFVGYALREMLRDAPQIEYGHGPTRTLRPDQLLTADEVLVRLFAQTLAMPVLA
jgi:hypothetical protein